jgi:hypothetical protein
MRGAWGALGGMNDPVDSQEDRISAPHDQNKNKLLGISGTGARLYGPRTPPEPKPS